MTSRYTKENENSVTLLLKYRKEFDEAITDIKNEKSGELAENPGRKCSSIADGDFIQPCQDIEFDNFNGSNVLSNISSCNPIKKCYNLYNNKYRECEGKESNDFCEELNNFKKAYEEKMRTFTRMKSWLSNQLIRKKIIVHNEVQEGKR
ncbi:PIR protein [Plasmodium brasilianum]|uniref:PIR protein n=1 Tax=Plasmodium brasilianum TaxID=5824 RepID=UPI00350E3560|nr:PIR protein [Plasmodium brasilianum]